MFVPSLLRKKRMIFKRDSGTTGVSVFLCFHCDQAGDEPSYTLIIDTCKSVSEKSGKRERSAIRSLTRHRERNKLLRPFLRTSRR